MLAQLINKTTRLSTHPSVIINIIILLIFCFLIIKLLFQLFTLGQHDDTYQQTEVGLHPEEATQITDDPEQRIASFHLFGLSSKENSTDSEEVIIEPANVPETSLNLILKGVAAERDKLKSRAIILDNNTNREEFFAIRDNVFDLATIENIYHNRVLLVRNGEYETLLLPKETLSKDTIQKGSIDDAYKIGITAFLNKTIIQYDHSLTYPVTLDAVYRKGQLIGYSANIQQHGKNNIIKDLGLEEDDLIVAFNGTVFAESQSANFSSAETDSMTFAEIEILRDNDTHILYLEFDNGQPKTDENLTEDLQSFEQTGIQADDVDEYDPESYDEYVDEYDPESYD